MLETLEYDHPAWYLVMFTCWYLLCFTAVTAGIVFLLRGPLRRYKPYDMRIFVQLQGLHTPANNRFMQSITFLGKHQFLIPANLLLIGLFFFYGQKRWYAFHILLVSLSSLLLMFFLKHLFHRRRPQIPLLFEAKGKSFPSGHAMMSVCFYGLLTHLLWQGHAPGLLKAIILATCIILVLLIAFSRVYLQVHYLSDVLAGLIIGSCWLYILARIFRELQQVTV